MIFEDRIQKNPKLLRLKNPETGEIIDFEIQDLAADEIVQEGTEVSADILNQMQNETKNLIMEESKKPVGEFTLWQGNLYGVEDGAFKEIAICYNGYGCLLKKFPLKEGFTRKYKIAMEYTNTNIPNGHMFLQFSNFDTDYSMKEYLFDNVYGSDADGVRKTQIQDFDIDTIKQVGHFKLKVTPTFNSQAAYRIYRIYLIVYDVLE